MLDTAYIISSVQQRIGVAPRTIDWNQYGPLIDCQPPSWDWRDDDLRAVIENWRTLFEQGFVTMAYLLQANSYMFEFGNDDHPGEVVIWHDHRMQPDLLLMRHAAKELFKLKNAPQFCQDEWEAKIGAYLADEQTRAFGWAVPVRFRGDFDLRISTILFQRKHIPNSKLIRSWFPVVCSPNDPKFVAMVPRDFWPPEIAAHWSRPRGQ